MKGLKCVLFLAGIYALLAPLSGALADIYRYKDKDGVWHFTNIQTDKRYKLYIRSKKVKPSVYIHRYEGIIDQAARRFRVDSSLIKAVIKAESDYNHKAVSHKGAQGLMQLMPDTAQDMAVDDPFNPEENIFGGTRYLSILLDRFKNDTKRALAAYNAGPEKVDDYQGVPPYNETRTFIGRVLKYYEQYKAGAGK